MPTFGSVDIEKFTDGLHEYLERAFRPLVKRVEAVEQLTERVRQLEGKVAHAESRGIAYRGVYQRSDDYQRGDVVTHAGSLWIAVRATAESPGKSASWQLAVKGGGA